MDRFSTEEVASLANQLIGNIQSYFSISQSYMWLAKHSEFLKIPLLVTRLLEWQNFNQNQRGELIHILHTFASDRVLIDLARIPGLYNSAGSSFDNDSSKYSSQAEIAFIALVRRREFSQLNPKRLLILFDVIFEVLLQPEDISWNVAHSVIDFRKRISETSFSSWNLNEKKRLAVLFRKLENRLSFVKTTNNQETLESLKQLSDLLEGVKPIVERSFKSVVKKQATRTKSRKR